MSNFIVLKGTSNDDCASLNVQLGKTMRLRGEWEVGVTASVLEVGYARMMWIFCDVADYSIVNNLSLQLLDIVPSGVRNSTKPAYVRVLKKVFSSINVDIRKDFNEAKFEVKPVESKSVAIGHKAIEESQPDESANGKEFIIVLHFRKA